MAVRPTLRIAKLMDAEVDMPACEREVMVGPYHDGELSGAAREEFEAHLATCPTCAAELRRVRNVSRWLEPLRRAALAPDEKEALARDAVRETAAARDDADNAAPRLTIQPSPAVRWVRWVTAAAAAVFLFSVLQLFLAQPGHDQAPAGGTGGIPAMQKSSTRPDKAYHRAPAETDGSAQPEGEAGSR